MIQINSFQGYHPAASALTRRSVGQPSFAGTPPERLKNFQDVLERSSILQNYEVDLFWAYPHLSGRAQNFVDKITAGKITPAEVDMFQQQEKLGFIEEAADMIYEYYTVKAARHGILPRAEIQRWGEMVKEAQKEETPFFAVYTTLRDSISETQVSEFQKVTQLSARDTRNVLGMIAMKFAIFEARRADYGTPAREGRLNMRSEAVELIAPGKINPGKLKIWVLSQLYSRVPGLPASRLMNAARDYTEARLGVPVTHHDLMKNVFLKQLGRQELDFEHPEWSRPEDKKLRKRILKPFEELVEAFILKDCIERKSQKSSPAFV